MAQAPSTAVLVQRAAGGDTQAFAGLADVEAPRLLLFIRARGGHLLGADSSAEDVLQATLLVAWQRLHTFQSQGPGSFHRWLVGIAKNVLSDRGKYLAAKGRGRVGHVESRPGLAPFDPATSVTKLVARREHFAAALTALAALDPPLRAVVERHLLDGESLGEIAQALAIAKSTAWERLHRGMSQVRAALEGTA